MEYVACNSYYFILFNLFFLFCTLIHFLFFILYAKSTVNNYAFSLLIGIFFFWLFFNSATRAIACHPILSFLVDGPFALNAGFFGDIFPPARASHLLAV